MGRSRAAQDGAIRIDRYIVGQGCGYAEARIGGLRVRLQRQAVRFGMSRAPESGIAATRDG